MTTDDFAVGDTVVYTSGTGHESGVVTGTNWKFVFVDYDDGSGPKATDPGDLERL